MDTEPGTRGAVEVDGAGLEVLDRATCLRLLGASDRGRIAITIGALPSILPVRFVVDVDRVVLSAGAGTVLDRATDSHVVALQADGVDGVDGVAVEWSVTLVGLATHLRDGGDVDRAAGLALPRWSAGDDRRFVAISTEHVSGRRARRSSG